MSLLVEHLCPSWMNKLVGESSLQLQQQLRSGSSSSDGLRLPLPSAEGVWVEGELNLMQQREESQHNPHFLSAAAALTLDQ